jgi:hypothetical protein
MNMTPIFRHGGWGLGNVAGAGNNCLCGPYTLPLEIADTQFYRQIYLIVKEMGRFADQQSPEVHHVSGHDFTGLP